MGRITRRLRACQVHHGRQEDVTSSSLGHTIRIQQSLKLHIIQ